MLFDFPDIFAFVFEKAVLLRQKCTQLPVLRCTSREKDSWVMLPSNGPFTAFRTRFWERRRPYAQIMVSYRLARSFDGLLWEMSGC
jgi:hypothetical protein